MSEKQSTADVYYLSDKGETQSTKQEVSVGGWSGFVNTFRRQEAILETSNMTDLEKATAATAAAPLARSLKTRHIQMISIGGAIGTGLFVGTGSSLAVGGPAAVLIAFLLVGSMIFCTVNAMGKMAVTFPVAGSFVTYSTRFLDPAWGFAMGWNYAFGSIIGLPLEIIAASITLQFWDPEQKYNPAIWVAIFWVVIVLINLFGVKGYGEAEFVFSSIKVVAVIGFIILGIVLICGGGPKGGYIGSQYWYNPGSFAAGFKGLCSVFVNAAFAFGSVELVGVAAAEAANPRKSIPRATKQVFWRILLFYIISIVVIGCLVPYNDPRLLSDSPVVTSASPFVIAIFNAGIGGLPSVMNAVIIIAVLSVGNSCVFGCSRTLVGLSLQGYAPKFLSYVDRKGRPLFGIGIVSTFGLLCFLVATDKRNEVFSWMMAIGGLSAIFTWGSINLCHIRFRRAISVQGRSTKELAFTSAVGIYGSVYGFILNALILIANFWIAVWPLGGKPNAEQFFKSYLAVPVVLVFYFSYKIYFRTSFIRSKDMDIISGRRKLDLDLLTQELEEAKAYMKSRNFAYPVYRFWC